MIENSLLKEKVSELKSWLIDIRRDFHMYPELSENEFRTRDKIVEYLSSMGIENKIVAKTGVVGLIKGKGQGKSIALRADIDALPMNDNKNVNYKSKVDGVMHSCGHDAHTTILLGAAKILNDIKDDLNGNVKLLFQPAEETVGGAKPMIKEKVLENPYVDHVFGLHVDNSIEIGKIGLKYNQMNAASDMITIKVKGKTSHGAYPQDGIDALLIASQIVVSLQSIVSRKLDPRNSGVISIGKINGGYARNIISDYIEMEGIVRTLDEESRKITLESIEKIIVNIAASYGGTGELIIEDGYTALINDNNTLDIVKNNTQELLGEEGVYIMKYPSFGVEDFAFFSEERPSAFFNLGTGNIKKGIVQEGHNDKFDIDEDALEIGVLLQVKNTLSLIGK